MFGANASRQPGPEEIKTILFNSVLVLILGGGIGVWFPLLVDRPLSADSLATFTLAALAPLWTDILLPERYWKDLPTQERMRVGLFGGIAAAASFAALVRNEKSFDLTFATIGVAVVLVLLYRVAVLSRRFETINPPRTEDGGPAATPDNLSGDGLK